MCGIVGMVDTRGHGQMDPTIQRMTDTLWHRGPDSCGVWVDGASGVALGHRRLAILDLSPAGHQPMHSGCGRFVLVFNGEIYNHLSLRGALRAGGEGGASRGNGTKKLAGDVSAGVEWRGHSDTETLLAGFVRWGIEETLKKTVGMFALAVWDRKEQVLTLARDRMGEKPLYYGWQDGVFLFGSELKAIKAHPDFRNEISRDSLSLFLRYRYVPAPYSIYKDIYKLPAGHLLRIPVMGVAGSTRDVEMLSYWTLKAVAEQGVSAGLSESGQANKEADGPVGTSVPRGMKSFPERHRHAVQGSGAFSRGDAFSGTGFRPSLAGMTGRFHRKASRLGSEEAAIKGLEDCLVGSIQSQQLADVPVGAFLSGGIDSSLIVALMQANAERPVRTFTIGFAEGGHDEARYASQVARHLGTDHRELYVSPAEALAVIPGLPARYDEPFADSSQIPTFLVSQLARKDVTVSLSGDGGDELFGGYNRYLWAPRIWGKARWLPGPVRDRLAGWLSGHTGRTGGAVQYLMPSRFRVSLFNEKLQKLGQKLEGVDSMDAFYQSLVSEWRNPEEVVIGGSEPDVLLTTPGDWPELDEAEHRMMYLDAMTYLPDDILCKVDRAAMGVSLETRVPFLDYRVVEYAWSLPLDMKVRDGQGKWILRQLLDRHVPRSLIDRPKQGFSIPLAEWLRGPLREWAEALLDEGRLRREGYFHPEPIRTKWLEHLSGKRDWQHALWSVLMFQSWLEAQ